MNLQVSSYLNFDGRCAEAFAFYERCLGATLGPVFQYAGSPMAETVPSEWQDKIMHGSVTLGGQVLMGADLRPEQYVAPKGFSLSLNLSDPADADRIFTDLSSGGQVLVPIEKTFWAERFGMVVDRFGIPWMINCDGAAGGA
jgi:PhnB protein